MTKDLTRGSVIKGIIGFAFPVFLASLLQQLYNMVDSIIVGRFVGKDAFAAVGATGSINFLIIGFVLGTCTGLTIPVAQRFGAGDFSGMRKEIAASVYVSVIMAVFLTLVTTAGTGGLLHLMKTPDNIYSDAYTYIFIIFLGIPATILYNLPANISRALGDSRTPLYFLMLSAGINVALDLLFVCVFHMGVAGTATATVIAQILSGILCIIYMRKKYDILEFQKEEWEFERARALHSLGIGAPMGLQFSITAIGSVILQSAVNTLGSDTVAAVNAAMKIQMIMVQPLDAFGVTMATFAGQNLGSGNVARIREGVKKALLVSSAGALAGMAGSNLLGIPMTSLFIRAEEMNDYIKSCITQLLFLNSLFYIPLSSLNILRNTLQGLGHSVVAMGAGLFEMFGRTVVAFAATSYFGFAAICYSNPAAWVMANIMLIPTYVIIMKKLCCTYGTEKKAAERG